MGGDREVARGGEVGGGGRRAAGGGGRRGGRRRREEGVVRGSQCGGRTSGVQLRPIAPPARLCVKGRMASIATPKGA